MERHDTYSPKLDDERIAGTDEASFQALIEKSNGVIAAQQAKKLEEEAARPPVQQRIIATIKAAGKRFSRSLSGRTPEQEFYGSESIDGRTDVQVPRETPLADILRGTPIDTSPSRRR